MKARLLWSASQTKTARKQKASSSVKPANGKISMRSPSSNPIIIIIVVVVVIIIIITITIHEININSCLRSNTVDMPAPLPCLTVISALHTHAYVACCSLRNATQRNMSKLRILCILRRLQFVICAICAISAK